ncbi:DUF2934 domain-containing protein [Azotobacter vinelandii]|uniref:DUF2934 domain-containing protein n=1 Tax=Azotobacter vinelandii TaxID=354 RepID=UPI0009E80C9C|nr:DUF2934 domain-containing protein [Azotobacter vinelandii]WKN24330.1 DUF2934 domain-containing protein [Azotobacter vinelandii]
MTSDEQHIRELAYQIWQSEGCPEGRQERHWQMARELAEAESQAAMPKPRTNKPAAPRKSAARAVATVGGTAAASVPPTKASDAGEKPRAQPPAS